MTIEYGSEKKRVGRPRDGNPEETRKEILRAAERAFAAGGFSGATTRQIAGEARVNVATLHYHFGGKKGLYRSVLAEVAQGELPPLSEAGSASDRVRRLIGAGMPGGRFLFGTLFMPLAIPEASIRTMLEAAYEFGNWGWDEG